MTKKLTDINQSPNQEASDQDLQALKKVATQGAFWTLANYGLSQALRFGSNLILTHLLFPELFGLMSLVNVVIMGLALFSDIGIGISIVQSKRGNDPDFLNSAWTIQVIRGFWIWIVAVVIAYPAAELYKTPELIWLIPVIAIDSVISGFNSTGLFTSYRNMAVKKLVIVGLVTQIIALGVMITWAWLYPSIWALITGTIVSTLAYTVWSHFLIPGQHSRFRWDKTAVKEILSFGKWIFISTALTFLAGQVDRIILGKIFSLEMLGVYTIALTLSDVPRQMVSGLSSKIIFPTLSRLAHIPRPELRKQLLNTRKRFLMLLALGLAIIVSFGDLLILALYDKRYDQAAWMLPLLAFGVWPNMLSQTVDQALYAIGKPSYATVGNLFRFLYNIIGIPLGFFHFGILGAIIVVAMNDLPFYFVIAFGVSREGLSSIRQDIQATLIFVGLLGILLYGRWLLGFSLPIAVIL
ncbi:oligosaccharide flippase family protein [Methylobacter sp. S3L5C]|uniref:oligosaccharide flippase family protein n=1 Tax=Methylobacter sp. S3L5C TaxID=2839024 RepID=UPI001FAC8D58|nr:oligosaccharide flippase family protein [Methylobacter sp. S3L5C]UOA09124.1 oligosaccharide flippase family protein [Methylobacter sp. S3L5C]